MKIVRCRRAFYPCCAEDLEEPRRLLAGIVDETIFCDIRHHKSWESTVASAGIVGRSVRNRGRAKLYLSILPQISVLFYRRDSTGEGGSGIFMLSERCLAKIERFDPSGRLIITDGSNPGKGILKKRKRPHGYTKQAWNRRFQLSPNQQPFDAHGLMKIDVSPA